MMNPEIVLKFFLSIGFIVFFWYVFLYKTRKVSKEIGKEADVFKEGSSVERYIGNLFKVVHYLLLGFLILYAIDPRSTRFFGEFIIADREEFIFPGLFIVLLSMVITLIAQHQMRKAWRIGIDRSGNNGLVSSGLFGFSRNPVFVGLILSFLGVFLCLPNTLTLILLIMEYLLINIQVRLEEAHLEEVFGSDYREYKKKVRRFI